MELFTNTTSPLFCAEHGGEVDKAVHIGSMGHTICLDCLRDAVQMLEGQQVQSEEQPKSTIVSFISETSDSVYYNPSTGTFCHRCAWCTDFITDDDPGKMEGKERVHQRECRTRYSVSFDLGV